jgi:amino-acid N-acetyltransferase
MKNILPQTTTMALLGLGLRRVGARVSKYRPSISAREYGGTTNAVAHSRFQESAIQRGLIVDVLNANVTKRDARQFLADFKIPKPTTEREAKTKNIPSQQEIKSHSHGLDRFNQIETNKEDRHDTSPEKIVDDQRMHLALICLKFPEELDDTTLEGFAITISQLVKLGIQIVIVLESSSHEVKKLRQTYAGQAQRLCSAIEKHCPEGAQSVTSALEWGTPNITKQTISDTSPIEVAIPDQLMDPLRRGLVLIIPSMAYSSFGQLRLASSKDVMVSLTREFSSVNFKVDRVVIVDPIGGIPNRNGGRNARLLINLEQHFESIERELSGSNLGHRSNELNKRHVDEQHLNNLDTIRQCLTKLPPASSGLILTPAAAANIPPAEASREAIDGKEIRRKNLLIHNLLANRPVVSSSLPPARLPSLDYGTVQTTSAALPAATLVKRGMPLAIIPSEQVDGWQAPKNGTSPLELDNDPRINLPSLVHLLNDSFRRKLDVPDYLARTKGRIAGVIVAGEYEGGAILTWEMPPNTQDPTRLVPYLDKFAVLQSSQGSSGVADIVFQAMVENCFPHGVCWRSRKNNPVNKWYFERAAGSWKIPNSEWTMFWTGDGMLSKARWNDYIGVCTSVRPSWINNAR